MKSKDYVFTITATDQIYGSVLWSAASDCGEKDARQKAKNEYEKAHPKAKVIHTKLELL